MGKFHSFSHKDESEEQVWYTKIVIVLLSLSHISTTSHQQESSIADKPKEEIGKADLSSASSYMITNKQDNDKW